MIKSVHGKPSTVHMIFIKAQKYVYVCMYYRSQAKKRKRNMIKFINPNTNLDTNYLHQ